MILDARPPRSHHASRLCKRRQIAGDTDLVCSHRKFRLSLQGHRRTGAHICRCRRFRGQTRPADAAPAADGTLAGALFGIEAPDENEIDRFRPGQLSGQLPPGTYRFANTPHDSRLAALAFALGAYQFARYRKADARNVRLVVPEGVDGQDLSRIVEGVTLCRDLTNTPSNDM